jgi:peptide chain release factor 1
MLDKLAAVDARYNELNDLLASPEVTSQPELLMKYGQEQSGLEAVVTTYRRYREVLTQLKDARDMMADETESDVTAQRPQ